MLHAVWMAKWHTSSSAVKPVLGRTDRDAVQALAAACKQLLPPGFGGGRAYCARVRYGGHACAVQGAVEK
jgi:hypothetical protein